MREVGSEFWDVQPIGRENNQFWEFTQWYLSGRSALQAIIRELKDCHTVAMPSWCCDSMVKPFIDVGIEVDFYPVYWRDKLVQEICLDSDVLLLMDYFGYAGMQPDITGFNGVVVRDVTHSLFSHSYSDADYYFGSLRKWCGVWTGGYAWTKNGYKLGTGNPDSSDYTLLRERAMQFKNSYLHSYVANNGIGVDDEGYLKLFEEAEEILESVGVAPAAERDVWLAKKIDVERFRSQRRANAEVLRNAFPDWLMFPEMKPADCPMFVPILVPDGKRDELRRFLIKNDIYCPIHWPVSEYHDLNEQESLIYKNELSLVCDQRYAEKDMNRMVEMIRLFWKGA